LWIVWISFLNSYFTGVFGTQIHTLFIFLTVWKSYEALYALDLSVLVLRVFCFETG